MTRLTPPAPGTASHVLQIGDDRVGRLEFGNAGKTQRRRLDVRRRQRLDVVDPVDERSELTVTEIRETASHRQAGAAVSRDGDDGIRRHHAAIAPESDITT